MHSCQGMPPDLGQRMARWSAILGFYLQATSREYPCCFTNKHRISKLLQLLSLDFVSFCRISNELSFWMRLLYSWPASVVLDHLQGSLPAYHSALVEVQRHYAGFILFCDLMAKMTCSSSSILDLPLHLPHQLLHQKWDLISRSYFCQSMMFFFVTHHYSAASAKKLGSDISSCCLKAFGSFDPGSGHG